jgi:hypothetical protein
MNSPAAPFKAAQKAALRGSAALLSATGLAKPRVLTEVEPNEPVPYTVIGQVQVLLEENELCADEAEIFATVDWWSRTTPRDEGAQAQAMGAAIIAALNAALAVTGWEVVVWELQSETYVTDPDQSTHGQAVFHYLLTEIVIESEA